jgi:hypothetical protein
VAEPRVFSPALSSPAGFDRQHDQPAGDPGATPRNEMPKFMLILRADATADYSALAPEDFGQILAEYEAWGAKLGAEGRLDLGRKLTDQGGKVIWPKGKKTEVKDGPYVESKEVVGGVYVLKADDYDHAVKLCEGHPNFRFGSIEVRELDFMGGPEE